MRRMWLTSDIHLDHTNCINFSNRPFKNIQEMEKTIVDNINKVVKLNDVLILVGDTCLGKKESWVRFLDALNTKNIIVIMGNHDKWANIPKDRVILVADSIRLKALNKNFLVSHYPYRVGWWRAFWRRLHPATRSKQRPLDTGLWLLHGHTHHKVQMVDYHPRMLNVGVDANDFKPISMDEIVSITQRRDSQAKIGNSSTR